MSTGKKDAKSTKKVVTKEVRNTPIIVAEILKVIMTPMPSPIPPKSFIKK